MFRDEELHCIQYFEVHPGHHLSRLFLVHDYQTDSLITNRNTIGAQLALQPLAENPLSEMGRKTIVIAIISPSNLNSFSASAIVESMGVPWVISFLFPASKSSEKSEHNKCS